MNTKAKIFTALLCVVVIVSFAFAEVRFENFKVSSADGRATISWTTSVENGITSFVVERSTDGVEFFPIATFQPHGTGLEYKYIDTNVFKQNIRTFHYRVRCDDNSGNMHYSATQVVTISVSGIKQTWGSLKAMFR